MEGIDDQLVPVLLQRPVSKQETVVPERIPMPSSEPSPPEPIEMFISFSHKDEDLKDKLYDQLSPLKRQGLIKPWQDWDIEPGTEWNDEILTQLEVAGIILLLVSPGFIASDYCFGKEMKRAMERHELGSARVIPIIMKPCDWDGLPFSKLQGLPKGGKPVNTWQNQDEALLSVAKGVRKAVDSLLKK